MKILLLPSYFYPEGVASPYIGRNRNQRFADEGWDMVVYTPTPSRGISDSDRSEFQKKQHRHEYMFDGHMSVHRFDLFAEGENPILRAVRYFLQNIKQFNKAVFAEDAKTCDLMLIASTPPTQGAMAAMVKKCRHDHIPLIYNLQDIFPDSLVGTGLAKRDGLLWKIGRKIEDYTYKNADKIIVISQDFKRNIMAKGVPEEKIEVIYNWVEENAITPVKDEENELFEEFGICRGKFRVVYAGNLGNAQNIDIIVNAARRLKDNSQIEFVVFGTGGLEDEIKATKANEQLDNLKILPLQPYERVSKVYGLGHLCIVACKPGLGGAAMPSKTWSIMSSGRAVLANFDEGELKEIVENNHCGVFTKADDLEGFVQAIKELSQQPEQCAEMGGNGRQFIMENLTREVGTQKYVDVIKSVVKQ